MTRTTRFRLPNFCTGLFCRAVPSDPLTPQKISLKFEILFWLTPLLLPIVLFLVNPGHFLTPFWTGRGDNAGWVDAWIYYGYFKDLFVNVGDKPYHYAGTRWPFLLPGVIAYSFLDTFRANVLLHFFWYWVSIVPFTALVRLLAGRRAAIVGCLLLGTHGWFIRSIGWDYLDGARNGFFLVSVYLVVKSTRSGSDRLFIFLAGAAYACMLLSHFFALVFGPILPFIFVFASGRRTCAEIVRALARFAVWFSAGAFTLLFVLSTFHWSIVGGIMLLPSLEYSANRGTSDFGGISLGWIGQAFWLVMPALALLAGTFSFFKRNSRPGVCRPELWAITLTYSLLPLALINWSTEDGPQMLLCFFHYANYLIPTTFITLALFFSENIPLERKRPAYILAAAAVAVLVNGLFSPFETSTSPLPLLIVGAAVLSLVFFLRVKNVVAATAFLVFVIVNVGVGFPLRDCAGSASSPAALSRIDAAFDFASGHLRDSRASFVFESGTAFEPEWLSLASALGVRETSGISANGTDGKKLPAAGVPVAICTRVPETAETIAREIAPHGFRILFFEQKIIESDGHGYFLSLGAVVVAPHGHVPLIVKTVNDHATLTEGWAETAPPVSENWKPCDVIAFNAAERKISAVTSGTHYAHAMQHSPLAIPRSGTYRFVFRYRSDKPLRFGVLKNDEKYLDPKNKSHYTTNFYYRADRQKTTVFTGVFEAGDVVTPVIANIAVPNVSTHLLLEDFTVDADFLRK